MKLHITFVCLFLTIRLVKLTEVPLTSTWYPAFDVLLRDPKDIEKDLERWKIIPDLLDEAPKEAVQVEWIEGLEPLFGNEINSTITKREPFWACWNSNETEFYTMIFTGIDEKLKAQTSYGEKQFWIVGNIRDYEFLGGEFLTEYMGPDPPEGKGLLRYVFLVYRQPDKIQFKEKKISAKEDGSLRTNFSSKAFADKYNLGKPLFVNFFRTRHAFNS